MKNILYLLLFAPLFALSQTGGENYIKTLTYKEETETTDASKARANVTYYDGLGRPIQRVAGKMSTSGKDIITHIEYDGFGRQSKEFLPFPSSASDLSYQAITGDDVLQYYSTTSPTGPHETTGNPYSEKFFEPSPLNRVLKQAAPGNAWLGNPDPYNNNDHAVKFVYQSNTDNEIKKLKATATWNSTAQVYDIAFVSDGYYSANQLYKTITKNENWTSGVANTTEEFKNKEGQVVLKRTYDGTTAHNTYYVYDQYSNLTYVLPPLCNGSNLSVDALGYQYKYDKRNRLVEKKLPGKQWEFVVYDPLDRPILSGPAMTPFGGAASVISDNGWLMTIYDAFGRVAITGWYQAATTTTSRTSAQSSTGAAVITAVRGSGTIDGVSVGYNNLTLPTGFKLLSVNYYDDYIWPGAPTLPAQVEAQNVRSSVKGLPTGSWVRVLQSATGTADKQLSYILYDGRARPVRTYNTNYLGGYTQADSKLYFDSRPQYAITKHKRISTSTELTVREDFTYDAQDRLITDTHKINSLRAQILAQNTYNEMGQLLTKNVGSVASTGASLQTVDYKYNVRGWLTDINDVGNLGNDLFAFKIGYNNPVDNTNGVLNIDGLFNGNISETYWRSKSDDVLRKYSYRYDNLNRLKDAYYQKIGGDDVAVIGNYNENNITYDLNGNILSLVRNGGIDTGNAMQIDALTYSYNKGTNQLKKVDDSSTSPQGFNGLGASAATNYTYDVNGNMITDNNKGITSIKYNHLNLPAEIVFGSNKITYIYDAGGQKLKKTVAEGENKIEVDYLDGYQYKGAVLQFFPTSEGYVDYTVTSLGRVSYNYVYQYKDHLGNVRLNYGLSGLETTPTIKDENHYYPFGLRHSNYDTTLLEFQEIEDGNVELYPPIDPTAKLKQNYKYLGQERQDELGLNWDTFRHRNYDYAIGRFMSIDPIAEKFYDISTYQFAHNNPVWKVELEGLEGIPFQNLMISNAVKNPNGISAHAVGIAQGIGNVAKGLWNAVTNPLDTAKGIGNAALWLAVGSQFSQKVDNALGTNSSGAGDAILNSVVNTGDKLINGNGFERGEAIGEIAATITIGEGAGAVTGNIMRSSISNPVPNTLARVVPTEFISENLGKASASEVFVTAAEDIKGLTSSQIAEKLTIQESTSGFTIYEFPTPSSGISTPILNESPGFVGGGRTAGGAREFVIPNQPIPQNATTRTLAP